MSTVSATASPGAVLSLAISATFRSEPLLEPLRQWMRYLDIPISIELGTWGQTFQDLLNPESLLQRNTGINILLLRLDDWDRVGPGETIAPGQTGSIDWSIERFAQALEAATAASPVWYVLCVCPPAPAFVARVGGSDRYADVEERFAASVRHLPGVYVVASAEPLDACGAAPYYDAFSDKHAHLPFRPPAFAAIAATIARRIYALTMPPRKVVVLDCDGTLWTGLCGEDGAAHVTIDESRRGIQAFFAAQSAAGMLLCVCSRNDEADVRQVFARPDMVLPADRIVAWRVNWGRKSENLRSLASELGLGLQTFVFVDDDPLEWADVEANCPEVVTVRLPRNSAAVPGFLRRIWAFDHLTVTAEDRHRTAGYLQNRQRDEIQAQAPTLEEFIASLQLRVRIAPATLAELERVAQLTKRTTQFNVTMQYRTSAELRAMSHQGGSCLAVQVSDRFGDYGLVGALAFMVDGEALRLDTFVLSCRALGRGVERVMFEALIEAGRDRGARSLEVVVVETARNAQAREFLRLRGPVSAIADAEGVRHRFLIQP